jgi:hypothetical protein
MKPETKKTKPENNYWVSRVRSRVAGALFGDIIQQATKDALAAVSIRIDDSPGWDGHTPGPIDRAWADINQDLEDALEAWRKNFLVRRIVTLVRSYVVGPGLTVTSRLPEVDQFVKAFWNHPHNRMARRLGEMCDELTRSGELFPVLFTNRVDGMSYVRFVPAVQIREIETDPEDYETELRYGQNQRTTAEVKWWTGLGHKGAFRRARGGPGGWHYTPLMLHFAVNRPIGATRGESDLTPILPWCRRYSEWLKDRVRLNRQRTRQGLLDVEIADDALVETKKQQLRTRNPVEAGIYVHGPGETVALHSLKIEADDAEKDGQVLRLAIAAGANIGLHYLGEGESTNYATAKEMGEPTARFYGDRQTEFKTFLTDLVTVAYQRFLMANGNGSQTPDDLQLEAHAPEVARADNESLAKAAADIVAALREMREVGWITDDLAVKMAFKFAGEPIGEEEIKRILSQPKPQQEQQEEQQE